MLQRRIMRKNKRVLVKHLSSLGILLVGFLAGTLFHAEGLDSGGGKTDNLWMIWTVVFLVCILAGVVLESVMKWRKLLKK